MSLAVLYHSPVMSETPATKPQSNLAEFSVSELSGAIKRAVEEGFPFVRVRGEISGLKTVASGHTYFDLKDEKAVLNAIIWKQSARSIGLKPESGMDVVCTGRVTTYPGSSRYQMIVEQVELAGQGALMALLEERRKRLLAEGLFDSERKKKLPFLPQVIGVVSSPTGAVIRDIMHRLNARFPRQVLLWPVAVQGEKAAAEIAAAIAGFNALDGKRLPRPDLLIVARGGGSLEDLMAFNEEAVVRAAAASDIPLISAVGHETDTTLIDFAADMRAPTPTAAAELAVPVRAELIAAVADLERRALRSFTRGMEDRRRHLLQLVRVLPRPEALFAQPRQRFDTAAEKLSGALRRNLAAHNAELAQKAALLRPRLISARILQARERLTLLEARAARAFRTRHDTAVQKLAAAARVLDSISYRAVLSRGFALVRGEDGKSRRKATDLKPGEALALVFADGEAAAVAAGGVGGKPVKSRKPGTDQGSLF
jgi:exodeoxyribonuclease VII large subunit